MTINYIIVAHKNPAQFQRLVKRLNAQNVFFYVHIDGSVDDRPFKDKLVGMTNVFFVESKERLVTAWSDISFSKAILAALTLCRDRTKTKGYCVLLSGQDYPLRSNREIWHFFKENYGINYISYDKVVDIWPEWRNRLERYNFHLPNKRLNKGVYPLVDKRCYTLRNAKHFVYLLWYVGLKKSILALFKKKRNHPQALEPVGGSTWYALPIETVNEILDYLIKNPELLAYHRYSHVPDEILFHSLINKYKSPEVIAPSTTYVNWLRKQEVLPVTFEKSDLEELRKASKNFLFARKFDELLDDLILDEIDSRLDDLEKFVG